MSPFRERFEDKGRFSKLLSGIPTRLILDEVAGAFGIGEFRNQFLKSSRSGRSASGPVSMISRIRLRRDFTS